MSKLNLLAQGVMNQDAYWNNSLTQSETNPYPLAPVDKVKAGKITKRSYEKRNELLKKRSALVMIPELVEIAGEKGFSEGPQGMEILGAGLHRDLEFLRDPVIGLYSPVGITDNSSVACAGAEAFANTCNTLIGVCQSEIEEAWQQGFIDEEVILVYYAGMFVQNQDREKKNRIMERFGRFIKIPAPPDGRLRRRVYLLHARGEDNPPEKVEWKNTVPYFDHELRAPLEGGFGGPIAMEIIAQHWYWHQRYSFLRLSAPKPESATT